MGVAFTVARVTGLVGWVRFTLLMFNDLFDPYIVFRSQVFLRKERKRKKDGMKIQLVYMIIQNSTRNSHNAISSIIEWEAC